MVCSRSCQPIPSHRAIRCVSSLPRPHQQIPTFSLFCSNQAPTCLCNLPAVQVENMATYLCANVDCDYLASNRFWPYCCAACEVQSATPQGGAAHGPRCWHRTPRKGYTPDRAWQIAPDQPTKTWTEKLRDLACNVCCCK